MDSPLEKLQQRLAWLRQDPANVVLYRQCAQAAMALRRYDLLLQIVDQALANDPTDAAARFDRANAQIGLHDYRGALATLAEVQVTDPEHHRAVASNRALCHYCLGEYVQALPLLQADYASGQSDAQLLFMLIRSYHFLGQLDEAAALASANAEAASKDAALAGAYALMFLDAEEADSAARWSATALRLDHRSIDGTVTEGTLAVLHLQADQAQRRFHAALEIAPDTGRAWLGLGTLAMLQNDLPQAESHIERGLRQMSAYVGGWHLLAWTQMMMQNLAGAEQSLDRAMTLDRNFGETHGALATLDVMKGDCTSARHRLEIARRLDPDCFSAQFAAALLEDPTLNGPQSQQILQELLARISNQSQSALGRMLLQHPQH